MRQHVTGKLKIDDLKSTLTKICLDSDSDYKRTMIEALENFRGNIRERKRTSGNRIENFIDAVACNKSILMRRNRELCFNDDRDDGDDGNNKSKQKQQKPTTFDSVEQLYMKGVSGRRRKSVVSMENVAVGPPLRILESATDDVPVKMNHMDQATEPMCAKNTLDLIKNELEQLECMEKLQEISKHVDYLLKSKCDPLLKTAESFIEIVRPACKVEICEYLSPEFVIEERLEESEDGGDDVKEEFAEAEDCCAMKESKSLTAIKKKLNKSKENSCLLS